MPWAVPIAAIRLALAAQSTVIIRALIILAAPSNLSADSYHVVAPIRTPSIADSKASSKCMQEISNLLLVLDGIIFKPMFNAVCQCLVEHHHSLQDSPHLFTKLLNPLFFRGHVITWS